MSTTRMEETWPGRTSSQCQYDHFGRQAYITEGVKK